MSNNTGSATKRIIYAIACVLVLVAAEHARAFDLTGTWQGKRACKVATFGGTISNKQLVELRISQPLGAESIRAQWSPLVNPFNETFVYRGLRILTTPSKTDKGNAALTLCGTTDAPVPFVSSEVANWKVSTKPSTGKGTLTGASLAIVNEFIGTAEPTSGEPGTDTCKWSFKRVSVSDPLVPNCGTCGNAIRELGEQCDASDLGGLACTDFSLNGTLACTAGCRLDVSGCTP